MDDAAAVAAGLAEAIGAVSSAATADPDTILETLAQQAEALLGCDAVNVHLLDAEGDTPVFRRARLSRQALAHGARIGATWASGRRHRQVLATEQVVFFEDLQAELTDEARQAYPWLGELASALYAPIRSGGDVVGILDAYWLSPRREDLRLVQTADALGCCAGAALTVCGLYEAVRRNAEAAAAGERRLRLLVENISDVIILANAAGRITYASASLEAVLGYRPEDAVGRDLIGLVHRDERQRARQRFARTASTPGGSTLARWRVRHRDGSWRWVEGNGRNLLDEPGVAAVVLSFRDVTEQQRMDDLLHELAHGLTMGSRDEFFSALAGFVAEHLGVDRFLIGELKPDGGTVRVVALMADGAPFPVSSYPLAGTPSESVVGRGPRVYPTGVANLFPEDRVLAKLRIDGWAGVPLFKRSGEPLGIIAALHRRPIMRSDHLLAVMGVVAKRVEIELERRAAEQALRESEQRYRSIVESCQEGVWISDARDRTSFVNARMAEMLGSTVDGMLGRSIYDFVDAEERAAAAALLERRREGVSEQFEFHFRRADGRDLWALMAANPLTDDLGAYVGALAMVMDVGEKRAFEEALRAAERRVAQQEKLRSLGQMASGIAHDLNQALALIAGYGELARGALEEPIDAQSAREAIDHTIRAAVTGGQTLKNLLTFARPAVEGPPAEVAVADLLRGVAELTAPRWRDATAAEGRPIRVRTEADDAVVLGPAAQLREALTNLIFNAVDAMPHGGTIELSGRVRGAQVELTIRDEGVGMTPEIRARVFEPFFTTKGEGGSGLGLARVRALADQLGGSVGLESEPGRGTTVTLLLPAAGRAPAEAPAPEALTAARADSLRVLLVEDNRELAVAAALMLRAHGHDVRQVETGEAALAELDGWRPDVILSDLSLGSGINGWELAEQARLRGTGARFVLATGWGAQIDPATAREAGVDAVVAKPYTVASLLGVLAES